MATAIGATPLAATIVKAARRHGRGSSIAPLMLTGYAKIYLVDLRYISSSVLADYIQFGQGQDVLFLYSTPVLNNSMMLR